MGRLATKPSARFAAGLVNARLCESSWFARSRLPVANPPNRYAQSSSTGVLAWFPSGSLAQLRGDHGEDLRAVVQSGPYRSLIRDASRGSRGDARVGLLRVRGW